MKALIFDLDGTLYDFSGMARNVVLACVKDMFVLKKERTTVKSLRGTDFGSGEALWTAYSERMKTLPVFGGKESSVKAWYDGQYMPRMVQVLRKKYRAQSGLVPFLAALKAAGIQLAVFSDYPNVKERMCALGMEDALPLFSGLYSAWDFGAFKPLPRPFLSIARALGAEPCDCLVVGDRDDTDGEGARQSGMRFVQIKGKKRALLDTHHPVLSWSDFVLWAKENLLDSYLAENQQGKTHTVREGVFIPQMGIVYPTKASEPFLYPKKVHSVTVDKNYPFVDTRFSARAKRFFIYLGIFLFVFPLHKIRYGLKIDGRKNLFKIRALLKNGALTVSNHVYRWDFLAVVQAVRKPLWVMVKKENLCTKDVGLIRAVGGVPIPDDFSALKQFYAAFDSLHSKKKWIHVFPEGSRWDYYEPIRPFRKGAFTLAVIYKLPVIPLSLSYRPVGWLRKLFGVKHPLITVRIGTPLFKDETLSTKSEMSMDLLFRAHRSICALSGIEENYWPASSTLF